MEESEKMSEAERRRDGMRRGRVQHELKDRRQKDCRRPIPTERLQAGVGRREAAEARASTPNLRGFSACLPLFVPTFLFNIR